MPELSIADFAGWLDQSCEVDTGEARVTMTLVAATPLNGGARSAGSFRLEFVGPAEPVLAQGIMTVRRPGFEAEIFLVPIGRDDAGTRYEAIFF